MPKSARHTARAIFYVTLAGLAACESSSRMLSPNSPSPSAATARATLNCVVTFGANRTVSSFKCGAPGQPVATDMLASRAKTAVAPTSKTRLTVGGQNVYVTLAFSGFTFVANVFAFDATIKNLMTQPLGTTDGVTPTAAGTRAVITTGPSPVTGTGTITPEGDSGTMDLTAPGQPFWQYDAIIQPDSTSPSSNWKFLIPPTAGGITFQVEITGAVPSEASVLRWQVLRQGLTDSTMFGVWRNTSTDIYAVGPGSVLHYDGTTWSAVATGFSPAQDLQSVFGFSATDIWVVGKAFTGHFDGASWSAVGNPGGVFYGVWGSGTADVYTVGTALLHNPGTGWVAETSPVAATLRSVWGSDATHVWAVGDGGAIIFNAGAGTWVAQTSCTTSNLRGVWGSSATDVYAVGAAGAACHFDGTGWTALSVGTTHYLEAVGGSSATDVWIASPTGLMSHFNGAAWSQLPSVVGTTLLAVTSGSASSVAVVGNHGTLMNFTGSSFVLSQQAGLPIYGIWATDTNNIYASSNGTILHFDGTTWTSAYAGAANQFNAISGSSNTDIYAVGNNGSIAHFNGTSWSQFFLGGVYTGVWDVAPNTVIAVGDTGRIERGSAPNAGSWSALTPADPANNLTAVWANNGGDIFAVDVTGNISHSTGGAFTDQASEGVALYAVHGLNGTDQWAVGAGGNAFRLTGVTWASIPTATSETLRAVWDAATDDVYAAGDGGVIEHWNGGATWITMGSPVQTPLRAANGTTHTHIYLGGDNGVILFGTR
jgi:hypothetical protein